GCVQFSFEFELNLRIGKILYGKVGQEGLAIQPSIDVFQYEDSLLRVCHMGTGKRPLQIGMFNSSLVLRMIDRGFLKPKRDCQRRAGISFNGSLQVGCETHIAFASVLFKIPGNGFRHQRKQGLNVGILSFGAKVYYRLVFPFIFSFNKKFRRSQREFRGIYSELSKKIVVNEVTVDPEGLAIEQLHLSYPYLLCRDDPFSFDIVNIMPGIYGGAELFAMKPVFF